MVAMLLPLAMGAQALAPDRIDLQPNQKLLGHYTTDDITLGGCWGQALLKGVRPIATDMTPDELALFQGSKIVAFRVGLSLSTPVTRLFVIPVSPDGELGEETEWPCEFSDEGWNLVELETPYEINLPPDYSLRIGFDYEQVGSTKPISAVKVGTIYPTYCLYKNKWSNFGLSTYGNLSLQCICENDNFPQYAVKIKELTNKKSVKSGDDLNFLFWACTKGTEQIAPGNLTFNVAIDGTVLKSISNPEVLGNEYTSISEVVNTAGLTEGIHTLTVFPVMLNGEPIENPQYLTSTFKCFEYGFSRQMHLVEQFTSTYCTYCPLGSAALSALCDMRDDIAWVGVHQNMGSTDVFRTFQCDTITDLQDVDGFPEGSFDRTIGINPEDPTLVWTVLSYNNASYAAGIFSSFLDGIDEKPAWATVNVNSTFDATTRKAEITIDGELVSDYEEVMGNDSRLTVYITEDNLVAAQYSSGTWIQDYVHNGVLRKALVSTRGVALNKTGDTYKNEFSFDIPTSWNADNLNIVAFISRPLGNPVNDIFVTNANKRKFGEHDVPPTIMTGDVNMDGEVSIADVAKFIDYLLDNSVTPFDTEAADCNGDGIIDIEDAARLIDYLLIGEWLN